MWQGNRWTRTGLFVPAVGVDPRIGPGVGFGFVVGPPGCADFLFVLPVRPAGTVDCGGIVLFGLGNRTFQ